MFEFFFRREEKGEKGHHDKEENEGEYDEEKGHKKKHHDEGDYFGEEKKGKKGRQLRTCGCDVRCSICVCTKYGNRNQNSKCGKIVTRAVNTIASGEKKNTLV